MLLVLRSLFFFSNLFNTWKVLVVSIKGAELGGQLFCCKRELSAFYVVPYFIHLNYQPYHLANFFVAQIPIYSCFLYFLVASWRVKETERMIAICTELRKVSVLLIPLWFRYYWTFYISLTYSVLVFQLGATVEEGPDYCVITPPEKLNVTAIDTYDDHRMAMAFSLAACGDVPVTIKDPGCTRKTFPDYFEVLERLTKH